MICRSCGTEVDEAGVYCHKCGARLLTQDDADAQAAPAPARDSGPAAEAPPDSLSPRERFHEAAAARRSTADEPERDIWVGGYSAKDMVGTWTLYTLVAVGVAVLAFLFRSWLPWWIPTVVVVLLFLYGAGVLTYRRWSVRYRLTNKRFFHELGILKRVTDRIEVIDMDDITVEQTIVDRMFGVGTLKITSSDRTHPVLVLRGIDNVQQVAGEMDEVRLAERRRRGLHIESI